MRTKNFLIILCCVIATSLVLIILGPTGQQNQSIKDIIDGTHQQFREFKEQLRVSDEKKLDIDPKFLALLGFTQTIYNGTKSNFSIVTYALKGQAASLILLAQNMALRLPNEPLLIYDLGLSEEDSRAVGGFCNSSKCSVIPYDLTVYPSYVSDEEMHAFRPLVIKDALTRAHTVLFIENSVRVRGGSREVYDLVRTVSASGSGVLGWVTRQAVSARTHPKMFEYFQVTKESFLFLPMEQLRVSDEKKLDIDPKFLALLGFTQTIYNGTKSNFSIVTYALKGQAASLILLAQNMALRLPNEPLLIYDLGLSEEDSRAVGGFCNSSKCSVIPYDLTVYPTYVSDEEMHAFRPL
uniref:Uncharacterized protein n=1 Tax=Lutzomyia longipalpis TaxID=7200 RepID=A0A1B0CQ33_LUTLO